MAAQEDGATSAAAATVDYFHSCEISRSLNPNGRCLTRPPAGPGSSPQVNPPPPTVNHGIPKEERDRDRGKKTRVGEPPGDKVGTKERGRGGGRAWHTRVTALQRQRGQLEKNRQDQQRASRWVGEQAWKGAQGGETGVARRRAGG